MFRHSFNIIIINVFQHMITKNQLYKHQYVSSCIMIFFGILLNIINLYGITLEDVPMVIVSVLLEVIYSIGIVLAKYGMDELFCSPFEITFYEGIFALILNIISLSIATNISIPLEKYYYYFKLCKTTEYKGEFYLDNFYKYIDELDFFEALLFIVHMIARASFNLFSHITIKYYTSSHVILILILGEFFLSFREKTTKDILISFSIFFVELFMILIFCEIIELNFFVDFQKIQEKILKKEQNYLCMMI